MPKFQNDSLTLYHAPNGKAYAPGENFELTDEEAKNPGHVIYVESGKISTVASLGAVSKRATLAAISSAKSTDELRAVAEELESMKVEPDEEVKKAFAQAAERFRPAGPPSPPPVL